MSDLIRENILIPLQDGTELAASVYRPNKSSPVPALFSYYPYHKDGLIGGMFDHPRRYFAENGFADVLVDFRGTGGSSGYCSETWDAVQEGRDGAEALEWIANQDWCTGDVGMWGMSYGGITTFNVASQAPKSLKAILPLYGTADIYADFIFPGGVQNAIGNQLRETYMLAMDMAPPALIDSEGRWEDIWRDHLSRLNNGDIWSLEWLNHRDRDEYWQARMPELENISVPAFLISGWNDIFPDGMLNAFDRLPDPKRLVVGPWVHVLPDLSPVEPWEWLPEALAWWNRWLKEGPAPQAVEESTVKWFVQGANEWRDSHWPLKEVGIERFHLAADGGMSLDEEPSDRRIDFVGRATTGLHGPLFDPMGTGLGYPLDCGSDLAESLSFISEQFEESLEIAGQPIVHLSVEVVSGTEVEFAAKLYEVRRDGAVRHVATGWRNLAHRDGLESRAPVAEGVPYEVDIQLWATAYKLEPGSRLALGIATADFPHSFPTSTMPEISIRPAASHIDLPVVTDGVGTLSDITRPDGSIDTSGWVVDAEPHWLIERNVVEDSVSVTYGSTIRMAPVQGGALDLSMTSTAYVRNDSPHGAHARSSSKMRFTLSNGGKVDVFADSRVARTSMHLTGKIVRDGVVVFEGSWEND